LLFVLHVEKGCVRKKKKKEVCVCIFYLCYWIIKIKKTKKN
jgi:hypothetical protein